MGFPGPHNMIEVATEYCGLVERADELESREWLRRMAVVLPRLHAAVASIDAAHVPLSCYEHRADYEARFELFARIRALLGEHDPYWLDFDRQGDEHCKSGSLADDFADIYFDLKHVLEWLRQHPESPEEALAIWRTGYHLHWGQHVVDASRHVYSLVTQEWHQALEEPAVQDG